MEFILIGTDEDDECTVHSAQRNEKRNSMKTDCSYPKL